MKGGKENTTSSANPNPSGTAPTPPGSALGLLDLPPGPLAPPLGLTVRVFDGRQREAAEVGLVVRFDVARQSFGDDARHPGEPEQVARVNFRLQPETGDNQKNAGSQDLESLRE